MEFELHAFDFETLFILRDHLRGEMIGGRRAPATRGQRSLLLLLVVLLRDDFNAGGERGESVDMVSVAVRENDGGDRLRRDLRDILQQFFPAGRGRLGVDDDHAFVADDDAAVSAAALNPVNVGLQLMGHERRGRVGPALTAAPRPAQPARSERRLRIRWQDLFDNT